MCAIGRNLDTSVGANSPAATMLGGASIGALANTSRRATNGTLLTGGQTTGAGRSPTGGGVAGKPSPTQMER